MKKDNRPFVSWELMNSFLIDAFVGYGVPEEDAQICADVLLESVLKELRTMFSIICSYNYVTKLCYQKE